MKLAKMRNIRFLSPLFHRVSFFALGKGVNFGPLGVTDIVCPCGRMVETETVKRKEMISTRTTLPKKEENRIRLRTRGNNQGGLTGQEKYGFSTNGLFHNNVVIARFSLLTSSPHERWPNPTQINMLQ